MLFYFFSFLYSMYCMFLCYQLYRCAFVTMLIKDESVSQTKYRDTWYNTCCQKAQKCIHNNTNNLTYRLHRKINCKISGNANSNVSWTIHVMFVTCHWWHQWSLTGVSALRRKVSCYTQKTWQFALIKYYRHITVFNFLCGSARPTCTVHTTVLGYTFL